MRFSIRNSIVATGRDKYLLVYARGAYQVWRSREMSGKYMLVRVLGENEGEVLKEVEIGPRWFRTLNELVENIEYLEGRC